MAAARDFDDVRRIIAKADGQQDVLRLDAPDQLAQHSADAVEQVGR
jgi:hypothetical protein